jgi:hypothetical protein
LSVSSGSPSWTHASNTCCTRPVPSSSPPPSPLLRHCPSTALPTHAHCFTAAYPCRAQR